MNGEASHCDNYDCHKRGNNLVCGRCICTRDESADQADISDDHDAEQNLRYAICSLALSSFDTGKD